MRSVRSFFRSTLDVILTPVLVCLWFMRSKKARIQEAREHYIEGFNLNRIDLEEDHQGAFHNKKKCDLCRAMAKDPELWYEYTRRRYAYWESQG